jgi:type IV pilus assembly protein PilX
MKTISTLQNLRSQQGIALVTSLILMLLMTVVALSVFRNNNLVEKMTGNTREKQRSFQVAEAALQYGEYWLTQQSAATLTGAGVATCSTTTALTSLQVCNVAAGQTAAQVATLKTYNGFSPYGMVVASGGETQTDGDINYSSKPGIYIANIGTYAGTSQILFQVTAIGYGGGAGGTSTQSIVQSQYILGSTSVCGNACSGGNNGSSSSTSSGGTGAGATPGSSLGGA